MAWALKPIRLLPHFRHLERICLETLTMTAAQELAVQYTPPAKHTSACLCLCEVTVSDNCRNKANAIWSAGSWAPGLVASGSLTFSFLPARLSLLLIPVLEWNIFMHASRMQHNSKMGLGKKGVHWKKWILNAVLSGYRMCIWTNWILLGVRVAKSINLRSIMCLSTTMEYSIINYNESNPYWEVMRFSSLCLSLCIWWWVVASFKPLILSSICIYYK